MFLPIFMLTVSSRCIRHSLFLLDLCCPECQVISLGRGQESEARRAIAQMMADGGWVVLQNGHLSVDFLTEALAQVTSSDTVHGEFRLWITAEPSNQFPVSVLQVAQSFYSLCGCYNCDSTSIRRLFDCLSKVLELTMT